MPWSRLVPIILFVSVSAKAKTTLMGEIGLSSGFITSYESILNPRNRIFEQAYSDFLADFRAELKIVDEKTKYILRPRFTESYQMYSLTSPDEKKLRSKGHVDLTDAFVEWTPFSQWQMTAGLFIDGWGPAEFVNPSNPFFHLNFQNKSFFYKEKGHSLLKVLWNPTAKTTITITAEPVSNNEPAFRAQDTFRSQSALRGEWQSDDASQIAGLVVGQESFSKGFVAEYFQFRHNSSGLSLYAEARHSSKPERFEIVDQGFYNELQLKSQDGIKTYSVIGTRWEGRIDARVEWIFYAQGYNETEWNNLVQSVMQPSPAVLNNAEKFSKLGLEFPTKNWWSVSVRAPNLGPWSDWQWINRVLIAVGDQATGNLRSGVFQSDLEIPAYQAWTFLAEVQNNFGIANTEMTLTSRESYYLGVKYAW